METLQIFSREQLSVSTIQEALKLTTVIKMALYHKDIATAAFLDISKAFDRVWHLALTYKLNLCGFRKYI